MIECSKACVSQWLMRIVLPNLALCNWKKSLFGEYILYVQSKVMRKNSPYSEKNVTDKLGNKLILEKLKRKSNVPGLHWLCRPQTLTRGKWWVNLLYGAWSRTLLNWKPTSITTSIGYHLTLFLNIYEMKSWCKAPPLTQPNASIS